MSSDFNTVLVYDPRLQCTDKASFAVERSGSNVTTQVYNAVSQGNNSHVYNVVVPNSQCVLDRMVKWETDMTVRITPPSTNPVTLAANNLMEFQYGLTEGLASFPLNKMCTNMSASINSTLVSINSRDIMPVLERMISQETLHALFGCPTFTDSYFNYEDGIFQSNNSFASFGSSSDNHFVPRGSFKVHSVTGYTNTGVAIPNWTPKGSYASVDPNATNLAYLDVVFKIQEPLFLSPFLFNQAINSAGLYGILNMTLSMNLGDLSRSYRVANYLVSNTNTISPRTVGYTYTLAPAGFTNSRLVFTMITPYASQKLNARNVLPYYDYQRYISNGPTLSVGNPTQNGVQTNTYQLNSIPDYLIIFCRPKTQTVYNPEQFLIINGCQINFNNSSGLLSNCNIYDLWYMSRKNGLKMSFEEFSGKSNYTISQSGNTPADTTSLGLLARPVPTCGSILVLKMGHDVSISDEWYAPSSIGNYNLQLSLNVELQQTVGLSNGKFNVSGANAGALDVRTRGAGVSATDFEIVLITVNSGLFVSEKGSSNVYTSVLNKENVLSTLETQPLNTQSAQRMVGGFGSSTLNDIKDVASTVGSVASTVGDVASKVMPFLPLFGLGESGAGPSGAGASGSGMRSRLHAKK